MIHTMKHEHEERAKTLFIFNRNLRLEDNPSLTAAAEFGLPVFTAFIFDPRQTEPHAYQSLPALRFMLDSITELGERITSRGGRLAFFHGDPSEITERLIREFNVRHVCTSRDYTPFARSREKSIAETCARNGIPFACVRSVLINEPEEIHKKDGTPYAVFTPYFRAASLHDPEHPLPIPHITFSAEKCAFECGGLFLQKIRSSLPHNDYASHAGRSAAESIVSRIGDFTSYEVLRDYPAENATTGLSAHLKFGTISPREIIAAAENIPGGGNSLTRQLYWRDFFTHIAYHFPHIFGSSWRSKYDRLEWDNNNMLFDAWKKGETGFPFVDAGMRELATTGRMHGRARMLCASFLVKDLHIDWRLGERYFASRLTDYDPAVNNGNWQWCASTGCDAQPYFRIFSPQMQLTRFDPDALYVKQFIPELRALSSREIFSIEKKGSPVKDYPSPVIDHRMESRESIARFSRLR
jgi:deoxyribodipyrimidine photo-lyase